MKIREITIETSIKRFGISKGSLAISRFIASNDFILFCLILFMISEAFKTQIYLSLYVYDNANSYSRMIASTLNAIAFECFQLLFTVNKRYLVQSISHVQALIVFTNNIIYYEVWSFSLQEPKLYIKTFIAICFALLSFVLTELYVKRWSIVKFKLAKDQILQTLGFQKQEVENEKATIAVEKSSIAEEKQKLEKQKTSLAENQKLLAQNKQEVAKQQQALSTAEHELSTVIAQESTLIARKKEIEAWIKKHTCPHCDHPLHSDSPKSFKAHWPNCPENPKNKKV